MPWALRDNLILTAMPKPTHLDKHGWTNIGLLTLCPKSPPNEVIMDPRVQWWTHIPMADGRIKDLPSIVLARNRSGFIGALVLQEINNLSGPEALAEVRRLRPESVDNAYFEEFLMGLERPYK